MDAEYALNYRELYYNHWWWRAREGLILSIVESIRREGNVGSILDVGCGEGLLFDRLSKFGEVEGVETNPSLIKNDSPWKNRISISAFDSTFQPGKRYSLILMLDVLEHFSDPRGCLTRALDLLESDGVLLLTVPAFPCLWTTHDDLNHHFNRYTKKSLAQLTSQAGMRILRCRYFFYWAFPVKLLIHYKERLLGADPQIPKVPPRWINELLYWFSIVEQSVFGTMPIPFGSSLVAVGSKQ